MRILILTHGRSGGLSLSRWIIDELNYTLYHEPFIKYDKDYIENIICTQDNIVVKDFPYNLILKGFDVYNFMKTFDKVIFHKRMNTRDTAISNVSGWQRNKEFKNTISLWHETYELNEEWIEKNLDAIEQEEKEIAERDSVLNNIYYDNSIEGLRTTYENIFENNSDITKLTEYLGIKETNWLDILNPKHKLRNGNIGMKNYSKANKNYRNNKLL